MVRFQFLQIMWLIIANGICIIGLLQSDTIANDVISAPSNQRAYSDKDNIVGIIKYVANRKANKDKSNSLWQSLNLMRREKMKKHDCMVNDNTCSRVGSYKTF